MCVVYGPRSVLQRDIEQMVLQGRHTQQSQQRLLRANGGPGLSFCMTLTHQISVWQYDIGTGTALHASMQQWVLVLANLNHMVRLFRLW